MSPNRQPPCVTAKLLITTIRRVRAYNCLVEMGAFRRERERMGLRFTRCLSLIPGLSRGRRVTLGLPRTGLYWTESPPSRPVHYPHRAPFVVAALIALGLIGMLAGVL